MTDNKIMPAHVAAAFKQFPAATRERLEQIRALIFAVAAEDQSIGPLTETLKWGEPAYLTQATGSGSTIRLGSPKTRPDYAAIYFNCRTTLVSSFRANFQNVFEYAGDRAILLAVNEPMDEDALQFCLRRALTYHLAKLRNAPGNVHGFVAPVRTRLSKQTVL